MNSLMTIKQWNSLVTETLRVDDVNTGNVSHKLARRLGNKNPSVIQYITAPNGSKQSVGDDARDMKEFGKFAAKRFAKGGLINKGIGSVYRGMGRASKIMSARLNGAN